MGHTWVETMALVSEGNTARVTRKTPPTDQGKAPIRLSISMGESIVVLSLSISTLASAGILTADSFGVIRFSSRNTTRVMPVRAAEHAKNNPAAMLEEDELVTEIIDAIGGKMPEKPWPVIRAWVYNGP